MPTHKTVNINHDSRLSSQAVELVGCMLRGKGPADIAERARIGGASPLVQEILQKAAIDPVILTDPQSAGDAVAWQSLGAALIDAVGNHGLFDGLRRDMWPIPFNRAGVVMTAGAVGHLVDEGAWAPSSTIEVEASAALAVLKAVAMVAMSRDWNREAGGAGTALLRRSLLQGVALTTDREFLTAITSGVSPPVASSSGADVAAVRADISALLQSMTIGQATKLHIVMASGNAKAIATMGGQGDVPFSQMTPFGGAICGIPVHVADACEADEILLLDCNGIAASQGTLAVESAEHATLRLSSTPNSDEALTSLWQKNLSAVKVVRYFSARRLRDDAVAIIDGVNYAGGTA